MIKTYFYDHAQHTMFHDVDLSDTDNLLTAPKNLLWIDLYNCTESEMNCVGELFHFHPLALEDCFQESPRAKIDRYDDYHFIVFHALHYNEEAKGEDEITSSELDVFLGANYIVTIHTIALSAVGKVARICLKDTEMMERGPEYLLYKIIDNMVDDTFPIINSLEERIDDLEDNIFVNKGQVITEEIMALKRTIILLRKVLIAQRNIFANITGRYASFVSTENVPYYLDIADNLNNILDTVNTYREFVNNSTDTYYSILSGRTNEIITVLTIFSVIMMPLTVITGFFGMNVNLPGGGQPGGHWFSMYVILLGMLTLSLGMLSYFRHRRWI